MNSKLYVVGVFSLLFQICRSDETSVKLGSEYEICCNLPFDRETLVLTMNCDGVEIGAIYKGGDSSMDLSKFQEKRSGFEVTTKSDICLKKKMAESKDDNLEIFCKVKNGPFGSTKDTKTIKVRVYQEINFSNFPASNLTVTAGESVNLECAASGGPDLKLIWRSELSGKLKEGKDRITINVAATAEMSDIKYTCEASTSIPKDSPDSVKSRTTTLDVLFPPELTINVSDIYTDLDIKEIVEMTIKGNPKPTVSCNLQGTNADRVESISSLSRYSYMYQMEIVNVSKDKIGTYQCTAVNDKGSVAKTLSLYLGPSNLEIISPNETMFSNYYLLKCKIQSRPSISEAIIIIKKIPSDGNSSTSETKFRDLSKALKQTADISNRWTQIFHFDISDLQPETSYEILVKICSKHTCITSPVSASFKTPKNNGDNLMDPARLTQSNNNRGIYSVQYSLSLVVVYTFLGLIWMQQI